MPTAPKVIELLSSGFEILGTFLLAVEAIKLPNLRKLRTELFEKALRPLDPRVFVSESASDADIEKIKERVHGRFLLIFAVIGFPLMLVAAIAVEGSPSALWAAVYSAITRPPLWVTLVLVFLGAVFAFGISVIVGYVLYLLALSAFSFPVRTLNWIETHTDSGVIGILGFLLFLIGAIVHAYLNWIAP